MREMRGETLKDRDYIVELYEMLKRNFPIDKISDWLAVHGIRYGSQAVRRTLKRADREDLIEYFIKEEDIKVGDTVRSRFTARFGKVIGIGKDEGTIVVHWDNGGKQLLDKHVLFKIREKEGAITSVDEIKKVKNTYDNYGDVKRKNE
jgi:hypothetical protein